VQPTPEFPQLVREDILAYYAFAAGRELKIAITHG